TFLFDDSSGIPNNRRSVGHVADDYRTGTNSTPFSDFNSLDYACANADMCSLAYGNVAGYRDIRRYVNKVCYLTIVIDRSIRINNAVFADSCLDINRHASHHNGTLSNCRSWRYSSLVVNQRLEMGTGKF